ncbi:MAG TPA: hypothetical protein VGT61_09895 [Thermomicrobiales bacterium]|nr:hypothetical protein [Thermomicrobiales bacterium]
MTNGARLELWVEPRGGEPAVNPVMRRLLTLLSADGIRVTVRVPEHASAGHDGASGDHGASRPDLVLLKTATTFGLSMAIAGERRGVRFHNGAVASWRAADKAAVIGRLAAVGLPVPPTWLSAGPPDTLGPGEPARRGWVTKPVFGVHGHGVVFHASDGEPAEGPVLDNPAGEPDTGLVVDDGTRLSQPRIGNDEPDTKVYVARGTCFAARKRFAVGSFASDVVEPVELPAGTVELVLAAGEALGLSTFGVDLRDGEGGPVIIDCNPFPGFRGFLAAAECLRAEVADALAGVVR